MSKFVELQNEDPSAIYASVRQSSRENTARKHDIVYIPLPHQQMLRIYDFYHTQEPLIGIINQIKNFNSLGDETEVEATYGGRPLQDPERRQVNEALNSLLPQMRAWDDMFGFVGLYDPNAYQDRQVAEIVEDDHASGSNAYELRNDLIDNVNTAIDRLGPLLGDGGVAQLKESVLDKTQTVSDATEQADVGLRADETEVVISKEPRISATSAPNSTAVIRERDTVEQAAGGTRRDQALAETRRTRVNVRRSLLQTIASIAEFQVVSLKEGRFYLERDRLNGHERVVYARNDNNTDLFTKYDQSTYDVARLQPTTALNIDQDVFVYVWPGGHPLYDGKINTKMEEVMRLRDLNAEAEENLSHADRESAFPTAVYQYQASRNDGDVTRLTDQQIHFGRGMDEDAALAHRLREEGRRMAAFEAHAELVNGKRQDELTQRLAQGVERPTVVGVDGRRRLRDLPSDKYVNLPEGFTFAGILPSKTLANPTERRHNYRTALASALGVPLSVVEGGATFSGGGGRFTGASGGSVSTGSAALSTTALTNSIMTDRTRLAMSVSALYDLMFREIDNEMLADMLSEETIKKRQAQTEITSAVDDLRRKLEATNEATERAKISQDIEANNSYLTAIASRYDRIAAELREIASMNNRFEIVFKKMTHIGTEDLMLLRDNFAIDELTFVNALRQKVGLKAMRSEAEMNRNREALLKRQDDTQERQLKLQAKYAPKPTEPSASAAPSAGAKKKSADQAAGPEAKRRRTESPQEKVKKATGQISK